MYLATMAYVYMQLCICVTIFSTGGKFFKFYGITCSLKPPVLVRSWSSYLSSIYVFGIQFFFLLQEKLFLTAANVQSTMAQFDSLPDPWVSPSH